MLLDPSPPSLLLRSPLESSRPPPLPSSRPRWLLLRLLLLLSSRSRRPSLSRSRRLLRLSFPAGRSSPLSPPPPPPPPDHRLFRRLSASRSPDRPPTPPPVGAATTTSAATPPPRRRARSFSSILSLASRLTPPGCDGVSSPGRDLYFRCLAQKSKHTPGKKKRGRAYVACFLRSRTIKKREIQIERCDGMCIFETIAVTKKRDKQNACLLRFLTSTPSALLPAPLSRRPPVPRYR